jgi:DNA-binding GntR family transcriptional regulator
MGTVRARNPSPPDRFTKLATQGNPQYGMGLYPGSKIHPASGGAVTPTVAPLKRQRLVDDAVQTLREAILNGRMAAGARLRQTDLADQLQISRTPIREALVRLRQEGLVELLPGGGVQVKVLDLDEAVELYDLREVLDGLAARLAAQRAEPKTITALEKALTRQAECVEKKSAAQWFPAHVAFHEEIVKAAANRHLARQSAVVRLSIRHFHPLLLRTERRLENAYAEHRAIYDAIRTHDADAAERLARAHIANAKDIVLKSMTQGESGGAVQG